MVITLQLISKRTYTVTISWCVVGYSHAYLLWEKKNKLIKQSLKVLTVTDEKMHLSLGFKKEEISSASSLMWLHIKFSKWRIIAHQQRSEVGRCILKKNE